MSKPVRKQEVPTTASKAPTHTLFHVEDRGPDTKSFWTEVAVGWLNTDGSVNLRTKTGGLLLPEHTYQLRVRPPKEEAAD